VAVEKLFLAKFAKIKLREDALISDLLGFRGILYPQNFGRLRPNGTFSTDTGDSATLRFSFA
jgi:hypothetical protein